MKDMSTHIMKLQRHVALASQEAQRKQELQRLKERMIHQGVKVAAEAYSPVISLGVWK